MKFPKRVNLYINLLIILVVFSGCSDQTNSTPPPVGTNIDNHTKTPTVYAIQKKTNTETHNNKKTNTPSIIPQNTPTHLPTSTLPSSTMTDKDREDFFREFIERSDICQLPCIWEIQPGDTVWSDVKNRLQLSGITQVGSEEIEGGKIFHGTGGFDQMTENIYNSFSFVEKDGVVTQILLRSEGYANPIVFQDFWKEYSPKQIILTFGIPTRVWLKTNATVIGDRYDYYMWLVYEENGFLVRYDGFLEENDGILRICPRFGDGEDIMYLEIYIQDLKDETPLEYIGNLTSREWTSGKKRLEEATNLTLEEFSKLFSSDSEEGESCFETLQEIWQ